MIKHFTDDNFATDVIEASKTRPVLVDFFAAWCGPCQIQGPIVEELAEDLKDTAVVGKLDIEAAMKVAHEYNVMSIPTIMIFKDGKAVKTMVGLQWKEGLLDEMKGLM